MGYPPGRPLSPEHRERLRVAALARVFTPEHRANIAAAVRGRVVSPETRALMSASGKRRAQHIRDASETIEALRAQVVSLGGEPCR